MHIFLNISLSLMEVYGKDMFYNIYVQKFIYEKMVFLMSKDQYFEME